MNLWLAFIILIGSFAILGKTADWFVDGAVGIADTFNMPRMMIGIVLVGFATSMPELAVSVQAAYMGHPEIALGNAIGSVTADNGVAMAVAALVAASPIILDSNLIKVSAIFLMVTEFIAYIMCFNGTLSRIEGAVLMLLFIGYVAMVYWLRKLEVQALNVSLDKIESSTARKYWKKPALLVLAGLVGVLISSRGVIESCLVIARSFGVSEAIIGLTVIAIGTSLPEISTSFVAARKGEGHIAAGNIIGSDVINMCWIAGASAMVNPLIVTQKTVHSAFPAMIIIMLTMFGLMKIKEQLTKTHGVILLSLYTVYLIIMWHVFYA